MNNKYLYQIKNLVSNTNTNRAMSGDELRARINIAIINNSREKWNKTAELHGRELIPLEVFKKKGKNQLNHDLGYDWSKE